MSDNFVKAIRILKSLNQPDRIINRDRINFTKLMGLLNNPFNSFKSIHITGTNGKGSVAIKTSQILNYAGYKTGIYTSPHLFSLRERIQINGQKIGREELSKYIIQIDQITQAQKLPLSYFQFLTAAGFMHFKQQQCQYVALEVGLGGKNDTTNIVNPEVSIITSIGLDHMDLLGPTKDHIAQQKSGIIKKGRPVVLGPNAEGFASIQSAIQQNNCKLFTVSPDSYDPQDFDSQNRATTLQAIKALKYSNSNLKISDEHIKKGLQAQQPCRMEELKQQYVPKWAKGKKIYFDVGHNPQALRKVAQFLRNKGYKKQQVVFVFGTSKGKKFDESLAEIQQLCNIIFLVEAKHFRACPIQQLQSYVGQSKCPRKFQCASDGDIAKSLLYATSLPITKVVVVSGSFFIMPQARGYFQPKLIQHPQQNINQIYQMRQK